MYNEKHAHKTHEKHQMYFSFVYLVGNKLIFPFPLCPCSAWAQFLRRSASND